MANGLVLSHIASYLLYFGSIVISITFAHLSNKYAHKTIGNIYKVNKTFWVLSFLALFLPLAFRGYGVDHGSYSNMYNIINSKGKDYFKNYSGMPEPLYFLMNVMVAKILGNFQWVYILSAFISLGFFYLSFSRYVKRVNLGMLVWIFIFIYYFTLYGLVRMGISTSIIAYSLKYLELRRKRKYMFFVIIATLFHYSAIIMIPVYFLVNFPSRSSHSNRKKKVQFDKYRILLLLAVPLIFLLIKYIFPLLVSGFSWSTRYDGYFDSEANWHVINNDLVIAPLLVLVVLFRNEFIVYDEISDLYFNLFLVMVAFLVMSVFFPIHRITYFFYLIVFYLYACFEQLKFKTTERVIIVFTYRMLIGFLGVIWILATKFNGRLWAPFLMPYYFNFPH